MLPQINLLCIARELHRDIPQRFPPTQDYLGLLEALSERVTYHSVCFEEKDCFVSPRGEWVGVVNSTRDRNFGGGKIEWEEGGGSPSASWNSVYLVVS